MKSGCVPIIMTFAVVLIVGIIFQSGFDFISHQLEALPTSIYVIVILLVVIIFGYRAVSGEKDDWPKGL